MQQINDIINQTETTNEIAKSCEISREDLCNTIIRLMTKEGYTRDTKAVSYMGEGKSIIEWARSKFDEDLTKTEVNSWFKNYEELNKVRTKAKRVKKVTVID